MNNKSSEDNSRTGFIIAFIVVAILSVICCIIVNSLVNKSNTKNGTDDTSSSVTTELSSTEPASSDITEDVDSIEILTEQLVSNLTEEFYFSDTLISYNGTKTFPFLFSRFLAPGEILEKVAVTYSADDAVINELKGGFGFNVTKDGIEDSQNRSDSNEWFQGEEFHVAPGANEYTYEYVIPENVREKIDFSGECQAGYWYGQLDTLKITKITFFKTPLVKEFEYNKKSTLNGGVNDIFITSNDQFKLTYSLKDFSIPSNSQIQCISLKVQGDNPINSLSGKFNLSGYENISIDRFSMEETSNTALINFFINPEASKEIDTQKGTIELSLSNDTNDTLTVDSLNIYYLTPGALEKLSS